MIVKIQSQNGDCVSTHHVRAARINQQLPGVTLEFPDGKDCLQPLSLGDTVYMMNDTGKTFDTWRMPCVSVRETRKLLRRILRNLVDNPLRGVFQTTPACKEIEALFR